MFRRIIIGNYYYLIFLLISSVPFLWIKGETVIDFWDSSPLGISFEIPHFFESFRYVWSPNFVSTGRLNVYPITYIPFSFFHGFLKQIPLSVGFKQAILFSVIIFSSLFFFFSLLKELFSDTKKGKSRIAFFGAIFYILNFATLWYFFGFLLHFSILIIPFTPLFLLLVVRGLKKPSFFNAFIISLSVAGFSVVFRNPPYGVVILGITFLYCVFFHRFEKAKFVGILVLLVILLNMFWILPMFYSLKEIYNEGLFTGIEGNFNYSTKVSSLLRASILMPKSNLWYWNVKYVPWKNLYYNHPFFIVFPFIILIIVLFPLLDFRSEKNTKQLILFFITISLIGIFLAKGGNRPFGFITRYFIFNVPYMGMFRFPLAKFQIVIIVGYSVLFGVGMNSIYWKLQNKKIYAKTVVILLGIFFSLYAFPFWTGEIVNSPLKFEDKKVSVFTKIPHDYFKLKSIFDSNEGNYRILSLPLRYRDHTTFNWEWGHQGCDFLGNFFKKPVFSIRIFEKDWDKATLILSKSINGQFGKKEKLLTKIIGLLNVKYAILHHDIDLVHGNYGGKTLNSPKDMKRILDKNNFHYLNSFGQLDLYKIDDNYYLPRIYTSNQFILTKNMETMFKEIKKDSFVLGNQILFLKDQIIEEKNNKTDKSKWIEISKLPSSEQVYHPQISFKKINPTKYKVKIENAAQPFFLVFSESYHPQWKAYLDKNFNSEQIAYYNSTNVKEFRHEQKFSLRDISYLFAKPLKENNHFIANGYANAWYIDPKGVDAAGDGKFIVTLYFWQQILFYLGLMISGLILVGCVGYSIWEWRRMKI